MRYLLLHRPGLVFGVAFLVAMLIIGQIVAPYLVGHFGIATGLITILGLIVLAGWMERRGY